MIPATVTYWVTLTWLVLICWCDENSNEIAPSMEQQERTAAHNRAVARSQRISKESSGLLIKFILVIATLGFGYFLLRGKVIKSIDRNRY